jgi:hypothetical protein
VSTRVRLPILLLILGLVAWQAINHWSGSRASGDDGPSSCTWPAHAEGAGISRFQVDRLLKTSGLTSLIANGKLDQTGFQNASAALADLPPLHSSRGLPPPGTFSGWEVRWWSPKSAHLVADVFSFGSASKAQAFVRLAIGARCRLHASSRTVSRPPGARELTWTNPEQASQMDIFFARGRHVYRVTQVPAPATPDVVEKLACRLNEAGCSATRK